MIEIVKNCFENKFEFKKKCHLSSIVTKIECPVTTC